MYPKKITQWRKNGSLLKEMDYGTDDYQPKCRQSPESQ
jgi:hypothetical protein